MPNRILREGILTSERVNRIADRPAVEVTYRRLYSVADDYGRFSAHPSLLRAALYPLRIDQITDAEVMEHLRACASAGLVNLYEVEGKPYLEILDFRQQLRSKRSKFPAPDTHMHSTCDTDAHHANVIRIADADTCCAYDQRMCSETETEADIERRESEAARNDGAMPLCTCTQRRCGGIAINSKRSASFRRYRSGWDATENSIASRQSGNVVETATRGRPWCQAPTLAEKTP